MGADGAVGALPPAELDINARVRTEAGYVALNFDYKGWGDSRGTTQPACPLQPRGRRAGCSDLPRDIGRPLEGVLRTVLPGPLQKYNQFPPGG